MDIYVSLRLFAHDGAHAHANKTNSPIHIVKTLTFTKCLLCEYNIL